MNKAFIRETEDETDPKCPACSAIGRPVGERTLAAQLSEAVRRSLAASSASFCPNPSCRTAYFDAHQQAVTADQLKDQMWPKVQADQAMVCLCLSITAGQIISDAAAGDPARVRRILDTAASCTAPTPYGRPCDGEAQRLFMKHWKKG